MNPRVYVDVRILATGSGAPFGSADPRAAGVVFGAVHKCLRAYPGRYAVAFPAGRGFMAVIRLFATTRDELDALVAMLGQSRVVRDYAVIGYPHEVPSDYVGPWRQYCRYRIPSRRADRHAGAPCRARRMEDAERKRLPYLLIASGSTRQNFGLRFEVRDGMPNTEECRPDGYGLARAGAPFSLPDPPA